MTRLGCSAPLQAEPRIKFLTLQGHLPEEVGTDSAEVKQTCNRSSNKPMSSRLVLGFARLRALGEILQGVILTLEGGSKRRGWVHIRKGAGNLPSLSSTWNWRLAPGL